MKRILGMFMFRVLTMIAFFLTSPTQGAQDQEVAIYKEIIHPNIDRPKKHELIIQLLNLPDASWWHLLLPLSPEELDQLFKVFLDEKVNLSNNILEIVSQAVNIVAKFQQHALPHVTQYIGNRYVVSVHEGPHEHQNTFIKRALLANLENGYSFIDEELIRKYFIMNPDKHIIREMFRAIQTFVTDPHKPEERRIAVFNKAIAPSLECYHNLAFDFRIPFSQLDAYRSHVASDLYSKYVDFIVLHFDKIRQSLKNHQFLLGGILSKIDHIKVSDETINQYIRLHDKKDFASAEVEWMDEPILRIIAKGMDEHALSTLAGKYILELYTVSVYNNFNLDPFSGMIFETAPTSKQAVSLPPPSDPHMIFNQFGYDQNMSFDAYNGNPLKLDEKTPIGYNIYLPENNIKAIFVQVYSGHAASDREHEMFIPGKLDSLDTALLKNGIVVVNLNLVNLRELMVHQYKMDAEIHERIHDSIHKFVDTIKNNPTSLADGLSVLIGKPIYLYGPSFGGRDAMRQAELHPVDFDGYISHDGILSFAMNVKSDLLKRGKGNDFLDPNQPAEIKKITKPLLVLQNMDDNNVNPKIAFDFVKNVKRVLGEKANIQLQVFPKGNPSNVMNVKGHYLPTDEKIFKRYINALVTFMRKNSPRLSSTTDWKAHRYNIAANKHYRSAPLQKKFVSQAYRLYLKDMTVSSLTKRNYNMAWDQYYKNIFDIFTYVSSINTSNVPTEMTDLMITKAISRHIAQFTDYILEKNHNMTKADISKISQTPQIVHNFRTILQDPNLSPNVHALLLSDLYLANPELLSKHEVQITNTKNYAQNLTSAKEKLKQTIATGQSRAQSVINQAGTRVMHMQRLMQKPTAKNASGPSK